MRWLGLWLGLPVLSHAQTDSLPEKKLDEVIIYSGKFPEQRKHIVQKVELISANRIAQWNSQNTGDLLLNTGNVFVQKSQQGGSSPVLRGFEASRVLIVVDGVRMNNAIYRSGHLQNVITVDQNMLERVEVIYGPASTLYGSDALGGVLLLRSKQPRLSENGSTAVSGSAFARYSTANNERTVHSDVSVGGRRFAWLQSYNYSDFGDLRMGDNYPGKYPDFGRRREYIARINGVDSIVTNADDRVQRFSGYRQWDITQKFLYRPSEKWSHSVNLQYSNSTNVPRYDRLQDVRNGSLRWAEWFYGPQLRELAAYELTGTGIGPFDNLRAQASYQHIRESRNQREYRRYDRFDSRNEDVDVYAFTVDGRMLRGAHELTLGVDGQFNDVQSVAFRRNLLTGAETALDTRYPNGENRMNFAGAYAQHLLKFGGGKWVLNDGLRVQTVSLRSAIRDNSFFNFPFTEIRQQHTAVTGNAGLVYLPQTEWRFTLGLSSGFRSPNIDDLARIFESASASRQLIVPNPDIKPEFTYNADLGATYTRGIARVDASAFYTLFRNAIALAPFRLNGQDSVEYNGARSAVFANQNVNRAFLYGANANVTLSFTPDWQWSGTVNYTYGRQRRADKSEVPLDHIPPVYGRSAVTYSGQRVQAEAYVLFNGWKKIGDYSPSGEDNAPYATPEGMPSWYTLNLKTTLELLPGASLQLGVENLLDRNYRYFASGLSAPGRNLIVALRGRF